MRVKLDADMVRIADRAIIRLEALEPGLDIRIENSDLVVVGCESSRAEEVRRLIRQTLLRELIYQETLPIRHKIYNG